MRVLVEPAPGFGVGERAHSFLDRQGEGLPPARKPIEHEPGEERETDPHALGQGQGDDPAALGRGAAARVELAFVIAAGRDAEHVPVERAVGRE